MVTASMMVLPRQDNGIKSAKIEDAQTAVKHMAFCRDISVRKLKEKSKESNLMINEAIWAFVSVTMNRCLKSHNDMTTEWVRVGMPISLRPAPKHETDFRITNEVVVFPLDMRLISDLQSGIKSIQGDLAHVKTSLMPFGNYYLSHLATLFPWFMQNYLFEDYTAKITMAFSNVPGPKEPWSIAGSKCKSFAF